MEFKFDKSCILKLIELALAIICIGLHHHSRTNDFDTDTVSAIAFGGFIIILIGTLAGYILENPINHKIYIFFCAVGCAMFIAAGTMNIQAAQHWSKSTIKDYAYAKGILAIINGVVFLVDGFLAWREDV